VLDASEQKAWKSASFTGQDRLGGEA
jgi:hypothetical protein